MTNLSSERQADVSVTLVLYNSDDHLRECLGALAADLRSGLAELVAVDNASPDQSAKIAAEVAPQSRLITSTVNRGFAGACNLTWPDVGGRYWLLLNPDVVLDPGVLQALVQWMDGHPEVGAVSPWLRDPSTGELSYPGRTFPSVSRTVIEALRLHRLLSPRLRGDLMQGPYVRAGMSNPRPPDWVPGAAMMVRRETVEQVGPLDGSFFLYGEDLDWCRRMRGSGWTIATCPRVVATHHTSASSRRTWREDEVAGRTAAGIAQACLKARGKRYARAYALVTVLALCLEAYAPGRTRADRVRATAVRRAWWRTFRCL